MAVVQHAVQHGGAGGAVAEQSPQSSTGRLKVSPVLARS
jgi:hypothetical protein